MVLQLQFPDETVRLKQLVLPVSWAFSKRTADFVVTDCNSYAFNWLEKWPFTISENFVCLVGEKGSGKTHLASIWGTRQHASIIDVSFDIVHEKLYDIISTEDQQRYFILDNADELEDDLMLFYIYNTVKSMNAYLLITAKSYPCNWNITLSDVKSRLSTISVIRIQKPNGETMLSIIEKMLERRGISAKKPIIEYIANRIERSYESINYWVKLIDNKLIDSGSTLSLGFIKTIL